MASGIIATPGYTDPLVFAAGGNPYGVSVATGQNRDPPSATALANAEFLGKRVTELAKKLRA